MNESIIVLGSFIDLPRIEKIDDVVAHFPVEGTTVADINAKVKALNNASMVSHYDSDDDGIIEWWVAFYGVVIGNTFIVDSKRPFNASSNAPDPRGIPLMTVVSENGMVLVVDDLPAAIAEVGEDRARADRAADLATELVAQLDTLVSTPLWKWSRDYAASVRAKFPTDPTSPEDPLSAELFINVLGAVDAMTMFFGKHVGALYAALTTSPIDPMMDDLMSLFAKAAYDKARELQAQNPSGDPQPTSH